MLLIRRFVSAGKTYHVAFVCSAVVKLKELFVSLVPVTLLIFSLFVVNIALSLSSANAILASCI